MQLIRISQVTQMLGISRSTLWRLVQRGEFPPPLRISCGRTAYIRQTVEDWILARAGAPQPPPATLERPPATRQVPARRSWGTGGPLRASGPRTRR